VSPALGLALLFVLIGAQVTRLVAPRPVSYVTVLTLAAAGVLGAELLVQAVHAGGPSLGVLHPVADLVGIAISEASALLLTAQRRRIP